jgi:rubrerythrin
LDKRYIGKYGESPIQNLTRIKESGLDSFIAIEKEKWKCNHCGQLLCVHNEVCLTCGSINKHFPNSNSIN